MSLDALPADVVRLILSFLELPSIHSLSTVSWHFQKMLCGNQDFWWYLVRQQLTENPDSLTALRKDGVNIRRMIEYFYDHPGRARLMPGEAAKYLLEKFIEKYIEDLSYEEFAYFISSLATYGHTEAFKNYREYQEDVSELGLEDAAANGHLEIVKYIVEDRDSRDDDYEGEYERGIAEEHLAVALQAAIRKPNNWPVIKYLLDRGSFKSIYFYYVPEEVRDEYANFFTGQGLVVHELDLN